MAFGILSLDFKPLLYFVYLLVDESSLCCDTAAAPVLLLVAPLVVKLHVDLQRRRKNFRFDEAEEVEDLKIEKTSGDPNTGPSNNGNIRIKDLSCIQAVTWIPDLKFVIQAMAWVPDSLSLIQATTRILD